MTVAEKIRELANEAEADYGPEDPVTRFYKAQADRAEGMIRRGRFTANPDGIIRRDSTGRRI